MPSSRTMYVNLAVTDLERSVEFFRTLGLTFDERFTDETATAMIVNEQAVVMLLVEDRFRDFTKKQLIDPESQIEAMISLSADSREDVDALADKALVSGGSPASDPIDMDFMYTRSFQDPDGHHWEIVWMNPAVLEQSPAEAGATAS